MIIEPIYRALSDEGECDWGDGVPIGYRVVSKSGACLGFGESRSEALQDAQMKMYASVS